MPTKGLRPDANKLERESDFHNQLCTSDVMKSMHNRLCVLEEISKRLIEMLPSDVKKAKP